MHERRDVAAELRDLADDRRRDEHVLLGRRQEQRFDIGIEVAVHSRHLELVFEVGHRAQAAQDDARVLLVDEIHQQRRERRRPRRCGYGASTSRAIATRSAVVKNGRFDSLSATPTMTWSKSRAARRTRSSWPRVNGSNVPGRRRESMACGRRARSRARPCCAGPDEKMIMHLPRLVAAPRGEPRRRSTRARRASA